MYAPQVECAEDEKDAFWRDMNEVIQKLPEKETIIIGSDLNGFVGKIR